jgi:hypothetical protein
VVKHLSEIVLWNELSSAFSIREWSAAAGGIGAGE